MTRVLFRGGRVLTPHTRDATAVLVEDDRIGWVGEDPDERLRPDQVVELDGRLLTPAFVDAHVHLAATGLGVMGADLSGTRSAAEALDLLAVHAGATNLAVVLGHSWDETGWAGGALFTREELDRAVAERPAYLSRVDMHSAFASSALLAAVPEIDEEPAPGWPGWSEQGALSRDAHHHVREAMLRLLSPDDRAAAIRLALQTAAGRGVAMVHEMGAPHINDPDDLRHVDRVRATAAAAGGALPEVVAYWGALDTGLALARGLVGAAGDLCVDGAIGSRTAALETPYADEEGTSGYLYLTADEIADHLVRCTREGLQGGFHVIGDRASAEVVAGFQKAAAVVGEEALRASRHRLEHAEMVRAEHMETLGGLGVTASMQPSFDHWWGGEGGLYETRLGDRARGMNAFASLDRAGVRLAFGSDAPVTPFDPWASVRAAVLHHDETERISAETAFEAHTAGGWYAVGRDEGGRIEPGAPAYLAVWDAPAGDPLATIGDPDHPLPVCVLTLVAGAVAYDGGGLMS